MTTDDHIVFIVDDDPLVLNALSIVLSREGYEVTGFGEGGSFLAAAKARTPTCIILDVQMPGQSGLDILRELNAQQYAAPIFIISGIGKIGHFAGTAAYMAGMGLPMANVLLALTILALRTIARREAMA